MFETDTKSSETTPFHRGEQLVQDRLGVREIEAWARKVVRDHLPGEHRDFHTALPFLVAAARDRRGRPWASLLEGPEGFVTSPDPRTLIVGSLPGEGDALAGALSAGNDVGILGIELATRRRNRVNGRVGEVGADGFTFRVDQAFGNCPQYIREREWRRVEPVAVAPAERGDRLTAMQKAWISSADTFFIASGYRGPGENAAHGIDASHRGGEPGFVQVLDDRTLLFPDYAGNNHFNTIGNLLLDPRAGLLFVDFENGGLLQLTGEASIDWDGPTLARFPGARRLVRLAIDEIVERPCAVGLRWQANADSVRSLRLVEKTPESADVTSFVFEARDGGELAAFEAGQHLPIELRIPGLGEAVRRTYSLSNGPGDKRYRITIKREPRGLASRFLHDRLDVGAIIDSRRPSGDFKVTCGECPLVLVSAGVGITPMMSILHALGDQADERPLWFVHGARDGRHHPMAWELHDLASTRPNTEVHIAYSRPDASDRRGQDYQSRGRVDGALLARVVPMADAHFFLCGPPAFMADIQADLERRGVALERIHTESFGPLG